MLMYVNTNVQLTDKVTCILEFLIQIKWFCSIVIGSNMHKFIPFFTEAAYRKYLT